MFARPEQIETGRWSLVEMAALRDRLLYAVRRFFRRRSYVEVQTPVRLPAPALEDHIDAIPASGQHLRTSPELHMKRMLADGCERVFQIGPCFRKGERGAQHLPEFAMLEWYRAGADADDLLGETHRLLREVAAVAGPSPVFEFGPCRIDLSRPIQEMTVAEAFAKFADGASADAAASAGSFEQILVERIEPHLGTTEPMALTRYPASMAALARRCPDDPACADRWELYLGGMEIASAFAELTDPAEQRARFEETAERRRAMGRPVYPLDTAFLDALGRGLPACAGIAVGLDRLLMILSGHQRIQDVVPFGAEIR